MYEGDKAPISKHEVFSSHGVDEKPIGDSGCPAGPEDAHGK